MTLDELKKKWNGLTLNIYNRNESLAACYEKDVMLTFEELVGEIGGKLLSFNFNDDFVNGYIEKDGKIVYFNYLVLEDMKVNLAAKNWNDGILLRSVKDLNDETGGPANYASFYNLKSKLNELTR